jgi:predicted tellurium resistance membrane protein TerC
MEQPHESQQRRATFLGLLLVLFFGGGFLLFMVVITGGWFLYVVLAVIVIAVVGYLHYILWGRALTQEVAGEREEEEARERWENEHVPAEDTPPRRF